MNLHALFPRNFSLGLYTDHYELAMAQGYYASHRHLLPANFDYFFRKAPFEGSYVVFTGLQTLTQLLQTFRYDEQSLQFLRQLDFSHDFLEYLRDFRFEGKVYAPEEGTLVFPNEPVVRVEGTLLECQLIETVLLNVLNFESLIATKAARIRQATGPDKTLLDFGLRRAQGFAGIQASRAAVVGGCNGTSNVLSAALHGLTSSGTQAHSWIQSFKDELTAFREYGRIYGEKSVFLVDTYDTLESGIPNAIKAALEMKKKGVVPLGIRLDSGDLADLAKKGRQLLDGHQLHEMKIVASNQLDEYAIKKLLEEGAPIDAFGVGTSLVTGSPDAALDGVYKISQIDGAPTLKLSENEDKISLPGMKTVYRFYNKTGQPVGDGIFIVNEQVDTGALSHVISDDSDPLVIDTLTAQPLHQLVMAGGEILDTFTTPQYTARWVHDQLQDLPHDITTLTDSGTYFVGISAELKQLKEEEISNYKKQMAS